MHSVAVSVGETASETDFGNFYTPFSQAHVIGVRLERSTNSAASYSIPVGGAAQLEPIPLVGIDRIVVVFDRAWNVGPDSLELHGVNTADYATVDASFTAAAGDGETLVAKWTLASPIEADNLLAIVRSEIPGAVTLDGDWTNPTDGETGSVFPSGDGNTGGDFAFRFNVLAGDANRDGQVNTSDVAHLAQNGFVDALHANYDARHDLDGNGVVNVVDAVLARDRIGASLPTGEPQAPPSPDATAVPSPAAAIIARAAGRPASTLGDTTARARGRRSMSIDADSADRAVGQIWSENSMRLRGMRLRRIDLIAPPGD
jgi:hypothetical protein